LITGFDLHLSDQKKKEKKKKKGKKEKWKFFCSAELGYFVSLSSSFFFGRFLAKTTKKLCPVPFSLEGSALETWFEGFISPLFLLLLLLLHG
jgi:hypothetical protein